MESLDKLNDLIKSCILPELKHDLDSIPIEREHFETYHENLEIQLPVLYDWIQQQPNDFIWNGESSERIKLEIQTNLIVLLCEISSPSIFQLPHLRLRENAERIFKNLLKFDKEVEELLFNYYEDKLHKDKWKKQLGAVHGFVKYLELRFSNPHNHDINMSNKFLMFCLSVSLNIRTCYETHYKSLSTTIFLLMLQKGANDDIISMNIHSVIYDAVFKDIHIMDSNNFIVLQWNCLLKCLDFYNNFDSFTWNYLDDMMEVLIRNITLAPDTSSSICLLKFVNKLIVYFTINHKDFEEIFSRMPITENINQLRSLAQTNTSYTCYRWSKAILQMFVLESYKLMQTKENAKKILQEMHKIYILGILPIDLTIIEPHLVIFLEKFIAVLMESLKVHKFEEDLLKIITSLLETFYINLQNAPENVKLYQYKHNLYKLLQTETFQRYVTI